ncbi:MAG: NAD+ synthase, partial [Thermodesulfobacteriota bacterium]|nr:NAD+ synthase [Thermodesulfobacteriota bacterium]
QLPLLYVNQVGGQDSILFDGRCLVMNKNGHLIRSAAPFVEEMLIIDTDLMTDSAKPVQPKHDETPEVLTALVMGTRDYVHKCGFKKAIIGLSGGIDSALTAAIACQALGHENVTGVALPSPYSSTGSVEDARQLAANLNIRFEIIEISNLFNACKKTLAPLFQDRAEDVTEQNIQARLRGMLLMALANKFDSLLLSTGNKSELAVGYCTLYGDMNGGLAVISDLPKMLVYDLARYLNRKKEVIPWSTITKPPSAELAPDQTDQDDLPPYEVLDSILKAYLEDHYSLAEIVNMGFAQNVVEDIIRRIKRNEYKRKQAPMGLKVTGKAFGFGRRYPTAEHFKEKS